MIYCNNAATTWPKPEVVYQTVDSCFREMNSPLRTSSSEGKKCTDLLQSTREKAAQFFGIQDSSNLMFTPGCTYALNQAILGLPWQAGDKIIMSGLEHHAVSRPVRKLAEEKKINFEVVPYKVDQPIDLNFLEEKLKAGGIKLVACTMGSNVTGDLLPVKDVISLARQHGALTLIDAAQAAGILPINIAELGADMLAVAGHKGLLAATGVGVLYIKPGLTLSTLTEGGTGGDSGKHEMTTSVPSRHEIGTHNLLSIASLGAGVDWIKETGMQKIREHEQALTNKFLSGLEKFEDITIYGTKNIDARTAAVSITFDTTTPQKVGTWLSDTHQVSTRPGFHCAPLPMKLLGPALVMEL